MKLNELNKRKKLKKAFTLIEIIVVTVMIGILFSIMTGIQISSVDFFKSKLVGTLVNNDNRYFKFDGNTLEICKIILTGAINNTKLVYANKCIKKHFYFPLGNETFYKVQGLFMDDKLNLISLDYRNIFSIKNGILHIK